MAMIIFFASCSINHTESRSSNSKPFVLDCRN